MIVQGGHRAKKILESFYLEDLGKHTIYKTLPGKPGK